MQYPSPYGGGNLLQQDGLYGQLQPQQSYQPSSWNVNLSDPKQRLQTMSRIRTRLDLPKRGSLYQGPAITTTTTLTIQHDPVILMDTFLQVMRQESGGVFTVPQDVPVPAGVTNVMRPQLDGISHARIELFIDCIPPDLAVANAYRSGTPMRVHNVNGGYVEVPHDQLTTMDMIRSFSEEVGQSQLAVHAAREALNGIRLNDREAWITSINRLVQYARSSELDYNAPNLIEEQYFWRLLSTRDLAKLLERAVVLCMPKTIDHLSYTGFLLVQNQQHEATLRNYPVDRHALGSPGMVERGRIVKECFDDTTKALSQQATRYRRPTSHETTDKVHAVSLRFPPGTNHSTHSAKAAKPRNPTAFTLGNHTDSDASGDEGGDQDEIAAVGIRQERHTSTPAGRNRTPNAKRYRHEEEEQPGPSATKTQRTSAYEVSRRPRRDTDTRGANRQNERPREEQQQVQTPETPGSAATEWDVTNYIRKTKTCFYHARGEPCPKMNDVGECKWAHSQSSTPIAFGAYPRPRKAELSSIDLACLTRLEQGGYEQHDTTAAEQVQDGSNACRRALGENLPGNTHRHHTGEPEMPNKGDTITAVAPLHNKSRPKGTHQAWVQARLWNRRTRQGPRMITVLLDTGAGGGNYASASFIREVERMEYGGRNMLSKRGRGHLRAANPQDSNVPPMRILGSCTLFLVFPPMDHVFAVPVREVMGLPCGVIMGAAFFRQNESALFFNGPGWFQPNPTATKVPLLRFPDNSPRRPPPGAMAVETSPPTTTWTATLFGVPSGRIRDEHTGEVIPTRQHDQTAAEVYCSMEWTDQEDLVETDTDSDDQELKVATMDALQHDAAAWEDGGSLKWPMVLAEEASLPGRVSAEVNANLPGPQPNDRTLIVVHPHKPFDMEGDGPIGIAKGVQWWHPDRTPRLKVVNRSTREATTGQGTPVATAYATDTSDVQRMLLLKEPLSTPKRADPTQADSRGWAPTSTNPTPTTPRVRVEDANTGQLGTETRGKLMDILENFNSQGLFRSKTDNIKTLPGRKVTLPLKDENIRPIACKQQKFSPPMERIVQDIIGQLFKTKIVRYSNSSWCSRITLSPKADGTYRLCVDYRALNAHLKTDSGGLGDITGMHDRLKGSNVFSSLDLCQAYHQLEIAEEDKHKTAFRGPDGRLYEYNVCSFGLTTIPARFSAHLGDDLRPVMHKGVLKWLDDILLHSKTLEEHLELLNEALQILLDKGYSVHFTKCDLCFQELEFLGVMIGQHGARPAPSKVKALRELEMPSTVGEVRTFLGVAGYLRGFIPDFGTIVTPISDLLRNKEFSSRRARKMPVQWARDHTMAALKVIEALTTHPVLALPDWELPFTLHTDASTLAVGSVLTQPVEEREAPIGYASKRFSRAEEKLSANDREVLAALYSLDYFKVYLQHRRFTLITDCGAIIWLFTSQNLSPKMHRWALRMMSYDMDLKWRKGTDNLIPDALSRLRRKGPPGPEIDTSFPDDTSGVRESRGPEGPSYNGTLLKDLTTPEGGQEIQTGVADPTYEPTLDGIRLADMGPTAVGGRREGNLSVLCAVQLTPDELDEGDDTRRDTFEDAQQFLSPRRPRIVVLGRGAGGMLLAAKDMLDVVGIISADWKTLECIRASGGTDEGKLVHRDVASQDCYWNIAAARPEIVLGNACNRLQTHGEDDGTLQQATDIINAYLASRARTLVLESPMGFSGTTGWQNSLRPLLLAAKCAVEAATLTASAVGIPTGKRRVFIVAVKARGDSSIASKLGRWKQRADHLPPRNPSVGHLLGKTGSFFLRRKEGESGVFSFDGQTIAITQTHIMGRKPQAGAYERHPNDAGPLDDAQELSLEDFAKLTTTLDSFPTPRSLRRSDVAKILEEFTLPPMLREVLNLLSLQNIVQTDTREEEQDLLIGLASLQLDTMEITTDTRDPHEVAMAITSSPNTPPKYKITPAVLRSAIRKNRDETTRPAATPATTATQTPSKRSGQRQRHRNRKTSPSPTPSPPLTKQTPEEIQQDVNKRHSARLEELENILRDTKLLIKSQCRDPILGPIRRELEKSRGENGDYVLDDQQLLWHAPRGRQYAVATPRHLVK